MMPVCRFRCSVARLRVSRLLAFASIRWALPFVLVLAMALPAHSWELHCSGSFCAVKTVDSVTGNYIMVAHDDDGRNLIIAIGDADWNRFVPMGKPVLTAKFAVDEKPLSLGDHGVFEGGDHHFLIVLTRREPARKLIGRMRNEKAVQFDFEVMQFIEMGNRFDAEPATAVFALTGFETTWEEYCETSPLDWLCDE